MEPRSPYRRAGTPAGKPRGRVATRAEPPDDRLSPIPRRDGVFHEPAASARERRIAAMLTRATGGVILAVGLGLSWLLVGVHETDHVVGRAFAIASTAVLVGPWLLAVGNGGAASFFDSPRWVKAGFAIAIALGIAWNLTFFRATLDWVGG
jgi:hypothetical protein